jgi:Ser/Thr protein kinase RdoA (MazF antagonist)
VTLLIDQPAARTARPDPPVPADHVAYLLQTYYGVTGELTRAAGPEEAFELALPFTRLTVRLSSSWEDPAAVDLEMSAMRHVACRDPALPVPRLCPTRAGTAAHPVPIGDGPFPRLLRLLTASPGRALAAERPDEAQSAMLGGAAARLGLALADFAHPQDARPSAGNLLSFPDLEPLAGDLPDGEARLLARRVFRLFAREVAPQLAGLGRQVCQAGFGGQAVLVDPTAPAYVTGIVGFGDTGRTAVALDVAIGLAGQFLVAPDPWAGAVAFLRGYLAVRPLPEVDVAVALWAAPAALVTRLLLAQRQPAESPEVSAALLDRVLAADLPALAATVLRP